LLGGQIHAGEGRLWIAPKLAGSNRVLSKREEEMQ
jgi:hypothetical protein